MGLSIFNSFVSQVHVSEQGFHEEVPSPPSFGGEEKLSDDSVDNQLSLTVDSLRRHTKAQELLYLQVCTRGLRRAHSL